ncbi:MAG: hypothetical protein WBD47_18160 [Phormidesmis sp.]
MKGLIRYFYQLKSGKAVLWCYLIWYAAIAYFHFDASPGIWMNSLGISAVVGTGLMLSVASSKGNKKDHWQTFRLYLIPFCVSSFSALSKDAGFIVFISPNIRENATAILLCMLFLSAVAIAKSTRKRTS